VQDRREGGRQRLHLFEERFGAGSTPKVRQQVRAEIERNCAERELANGQPAVVAAFRSIGCGWGGAWSGSTKDYMHFSASGH
jgi:hypothetical protein